MAGHLDASTKCSSKGGPVTDKVGAAGMGPTFKVRKRMTEPRSSNVRTQEGGIPHSVRNDVAVGGLFKEAKSFETKRELAVPAGSRRYQSRAQDDNSLLVP